MKSVSTTKGKRTALRQVEEEAIWAHQGKPHMPATAIHRQEGLQRWGYFPWRVRDLNSTPNTPMARSCTTEMSPQNVCILKPKGHMLRKTKKLQGTENLLYKRLMCRTTQHENQHKNTGLKSAWAVGERNPLTNLEAFAWEAGTRWDALWRQSHCWDPFMWSQATVWNSAVCHQVQCAPWKKMKLQAFAKLKYMIKMYTTHEV